jgi:glycosyltransferase involved in cell wall biosynthesis
LKILIIIPYFYPAESFGGPVKVAFDEGRELAKRGHDVVVYSSDAGDLKNRLFSRGRVCEKRVIEGMTVYYFRNFSMLFVRFSKLFITSGLSAQMEKELKTFDIIHSHEYTTFQNIILHRKALKFNVPYIIQTHGSLPKIHRQLRKAIFDVFFGSALLKDASKVIALNRMEVDQCLNAKVPIKKIEIIPNGINISEIPPTKDYLTKKLGLTEREKIVLYLGRLNVIKGVDILIKAFAKVCVRTDTARLVLVGPDDGYLETLRKLTKELKIEDKVFFPGPLYGNDKLLAYASSTIYVLPSRYETFPISVLEAYMFGLPVIASDIAGLNELVQNNLTGILVAPEDTESLSHSIYDLLQNPDKASRIGKNGRQSLDNFRLEKIVDKVENLYMNIMNS